MLRDKIYNITPQTQILRQDMLRDKRLRHLTTKHFKKYKIVKLEFFMKILFFLLSITFWEKKNVSIFWTKFSVLKSIFTVMIFKTELHLLSVVLVISKIKIWGKPVKGFMSYDQTYKQTNRDYIFVNIKIYYLKDNKIRSRKKSINNF